MERMNKWYKITDFLANEDIPFRECIDGVYRPDFSDYVDRSKIDGLTVEYLENAYMNAYDGYIDYIKEYFKGRNK